MAGDQVQVVRAESLTDAAGIWVGTAEALGDAAGLPEVADAAWDDAFCVRSIGDRLIIAGSNPRSALMGAYEYLRRLGAQWLWPGAMHTPRCRFGGQRADGA